MNVFQRAATAVRQQYHNSIKQASGLVSDRIESLKQMIFEGRGGGRGYFGSALLQDLFGLVERDYGKQIEKKGGLSETSLVSICLDWRGKKFIEAPVVVQKMNAEGEWETQPLHELAKLLNRPGEELTPKQRWLATDTSLGLDGNAYWIKVRSRARKVVALQWVPHWTMTPAWPEDGSEFISHYLYSVNNKHYLIPKADVIHFRNGVDLQNTRKGKPPLRPHCKWICADEGAGTYDEAILRKMGIAGVVFIPKNQEEIDDKVARNIKRRWKESVTDGNQGEAVVLDYPADVYFPDASPEKLATVGLRKPPKERIPAALGLNAVAVGLDTDQGGLNSSRKEFIQAAWDNGVAPQHTLATDTLGQYLVGEFDDPATTRVFFDYANVPSLQEDESDLHERAREDFQKGVLTQNEARELVRKKPRPNGDRDIFEIKAEMAGKARAAKDSAGANDPTNDPASDPATSNDNANGDNGNDNQS